MFRQKRCKNDIFVLFYSYASMVEWSNTTRCKRVAFGLRGFESLSAHQVIETLHEVFTCRLIYWKSHEKIYFINVCYGVLRILRHLAERG